MKQERIPVSKAGSCRFDSGPPHEAGNAGSNPADERSKESLAERVRRRRRSPVGEWSSDRVASSSGQDAGILPPKLMWKSTLLVRVRLSVRTRSGAPWVCNSDGKRLRF